MPKKKHIVAKPTRYQSILFRSRLEARHAIFYDSLGVGWRYERNKYRHGPTGWSYTPDFDLEELGIEVEVKPVFPTIDYLSLLKDFSSFAPLVLAIGGFWKGQPPNYFDLPDESGLSLPELLVTTQRRIDKAIRDVSRYRFDI